MAIRTLIKRVARRNKRRSSTGDLLRTEWQADPGEELKRQIYLESLRFIEKHAASKDLKEIPRVQLRAAKPLLNRIFAEGRNRAIAEAYGHGLSAS